MSPWPVTPMNRDETLVSRLDRGAQGTMIAEGELPLVGVDEAVELDQVDLVDAHALE